MSLPKVLPLTETEAVIELQSLVLEERPFSLTPIPPRSVLPNRIAVVGNYLPQTMWNRDIHDRSVRRLACGIWNDRTAGAPGKRYGRGLCISRESAIRVVRR